MNELFFSPWIDSTSPITYFWHQDYNDYIISYWVVAIHIPAVRMVAMLEIC